MPASQSDTKNSGSGIKKLCLKELHRVGKLRRTIWI